MASEEIFRRLKEQADWTLLLFPRAALLLTVWRLLRLSRDSRPLSQAAARPWFIKQSPKGRSHSSEAQQRKGTSELRWSSA